MDNSWICHSICMTRWFSMLKTTTPNKHELCIQLNYASATIKVEMSTFFLLFVNNKIQMNNEFQSAMWTVLLPLPHVTKTNFFCVCPLFILCNEKWKLFSNYEQRKFSLLVWLNLHLHQKSYGSMVRRSSTHQLNKNSKFQLNEGNGTLFHITFVRFPFVSFDMRVKSMYQCIYHERLANDLVLLLIDSEH